MSIRELNRAAWDHAAASGENPYARALTPADVAAARAGNWWLYLSDCRPVPKDWLPPLTGCRVLCLAGGGGQQGPLLAAAGARVTVLDASPGQLALDRHVAEREGLEITLVEGDMADLSAFADASFDLIINPPSTLFVPDLVPVWSGCARVLVAGGGLLSGFMNPDEFMFDMAALDAGRFEVRHPLPFVEADSLDAEQRAQYRAARRMLHFSHSMEAHLGGLLSAGFVIEGFFEDRRPESDSSPVRHYMPSYFVVRARRHH